MFHNGALNGNTYFLLSLQNQVMLHASEYYLQDIFLDPRIQKMCSTILEYCYLLEDLKINKKKSISEEVLIGLNI